MCAAAQARLIGLCAILLAFGLLSPIVPNAAGDIVVNDDFEAGNTGFDSEFIHSPVDIFGTTKYAITTDPALVHYLATSYSDHTSGGGMMMAVIGSILGVLGVWSQEIAVTPGQEYRFSLNTSNWYLEPSLPSGLRLEVDGVAIGSDFYAPAVLGVREEHSNT